MNALHWFDPRHADKLIREVHGTLRDGGLFLLAEPVSPETPFAPGFDEWKEKQPPRYTRENWERFWSRANALLGYDHTTLLGARGADRIGDQMSVAGWLRSLKGAGFELIDVLWRDADQVILAASKCIGGGCSVGGAARASFASVRVNERGVGAYGRVPYDDKPTARLLDDATHRSPGHPSERGCS